MTDAQDAHAYRSNEIRLTPEDLTRTFVRATDTDLNSEFSTCNAHGFEEIGVVRDHECEFAIPAKRIQQKMTREIDVRTFLFRFDDPGHGGST